MKRKLSLYITLCLIVLTAIFVMSGCAIQSITNAVTTAFQGGFRIPKWDLEVDMPIMKKTLKVDEVMDPTTMFGEMLSGMGDASFDKITREDLEPGGKYYYPDEDFFGLNIGDYVINYKVDFPGSENMANETVNKSMIDQFLDNFIFSIDGLVFWPWPLFFDQSIGVNPDVSSLDLGGAMDGLDCSNDMKVPLTTFQINIDNTRDLNDILLKGIHSEDAKMSINFLVEKYRDGDVKETIIPTKDEIEMDYITIEGVTYHFGEPVQNGLDSDNPGLSFPALNFITDNSGDKSIHFNGSGDGSNDYSELNVDGFSFKLKTPDNFDSLYSNDYQASILEGFQDRYRLKISVGIDFGETYDIICDIKSLTFDLGSIETDLSMLNLLDGTDDKENLGSFFVSNLSLANAGIYFNAQSTLPVDIDLKTLFDGVDNLITEPPTMPMVEGGSGNGATITWFKEPNGDYTPVSLKYNDDCTNDAFIPAMDKDGEISTKQFGLFNGNSNMKDFLERTDVNDNLQRASKLFFVSSFTTPEKSDVFLPVCQKLGGVQIQAGFLMPISMRVTKDKEPMDLLKALNMDNMIVSLADTLNSIPLKINDLGFRITCENKLPVGIIMDFSVTVDESTDNGTNLHYYVNMVSGNNKIPTGSLALTEGSYRVSGSHKEEIIASASRNFRYIIYNDDDETCDMNGDASADASYIYPGTLFEFISEHKDTAAMQVKLGLLETDIGDKEIAVKLRDDNYLTIGLDLLGSTTFDFSNMGSNPVEENGE